MPGEAVIHREYRLALISDPEYATYHGAANVTSAKVTLINRVNQLYEDDLAITLKLIGANDDLNLNTEAAYSGPAGPCLLPCYPTTNANPDTDTGEACDAQTIVQNNFVAGAVVGPNSYDIGHLILGKPGGGVALLGVVGDPTTKASGCTGVPTPKGDFFAIDYVAHEMGHQFSGNHTFNGNQHNCSGGNRNEDTSVEPGSGSSIQAYAGICRQDNLQPHSDPYFSQRSIDEIQDYVTGGGPGSEEGNVVTTTTNRSPVVTAPVAKTIPIRTPVHAHRQRHRRRRRHAGLHLGAERRRQARTASRWSTTPSPTGRCSGFSAPTRTSRRRARSCTRRRARTRPARRT